jgi:hypothetical protein
MILKHRVDRDPLRGLATTNHQQGRTREGTDERECTNLIGGGCGAEHESVGEVPPREPSSSSSLRNASFQRYSEEKQQRHQALHLPHPDERERERSGLQQSARRKRRTAQCVAGCGAWCGVRRSASANAVYPSTHY